MIIDFRNRPPYGRFKESFLFQQEAVEKYGVKFDVAHTIAVEQRSMALYEQEKQEAGIDIAVMQGTKAQNPDMVELVEKYLGKYYAFAALDLNDTLEESLLVIERYVLNGSCSGISMIPSFASYLVDDEQLWSLYEKCEREKILLMIFSGGNSRINYAENNPIHVDNIAKQFPNLQMIIGHGCWPYVQEMCGVAYKRENVYLCPDMYLVNAPGYRDYIDAANHFLTKKMTFGSAYPLLAIKDAKEFYLHCGIKEHILPDILYHNIAQALKLESISSQ